MNNYSLNSKPINSTVLLWDYLLDNISFDNYWMQNNNIITEWEGLGIRDYPDRRISFTDVPQWDWQILNDSFFGWRTIRMSWVLVWKEKTRTVWLEDLTKPLDYYSEILSSYTWAWAKYVALDEIIDQFKLRLSFPNRKLKWRVDWEMREINATCTDIRFWTKERIYIPFTATFESQDAFWKKTKQSSYLIENTSDNTRTEDITNELKQANPLFILWITSWSINWLSITSNNIWITINDTINAGDVLYIDWRKQEVSINWTDIDYDGVFPRFENGSNNVEFNITWTYTADISIVWDNNLV